MSSLIISVSGLRGKVGESLDATVVENYITAYVRYLEENALDGPIILGYDGRQSGLEILAAAEKTLRTHGRRVLTAGVTATPTLGFLVKHLHAAGGVQVTASHNPHPWNGLKLFSPAGRVLPGEEGRQVKAFYETEKEWQPGLELHAVERNDRIAVESDSTVPFGLPEVENGSSMLIRSFRSTAWSSSPGCHEIADSVTPHLEALLATVNVDRIRRRKFRVVLDANHGSGSVLGRPLLEKLGCEVIFASEKEAPDSDFQHTPEPTEENLRGVCSLVPERKADVGFCQDPDADRLAVIDAAGRYIGEEYTVALCAEHLLSQENFRGPVVTNCSTSLMTRDIARKHGVPFSFSPVGEANVVDEMLRVGAVFAGEGNGGPIDPRIGYVRDSFVGMIQILDMMAEREKTVGELADELPRYEIVKTKIPASADELPAIYERFLAKYPEAEISRMDGLRLGWEDGWVLIRGSNTEPVVRIIAEAKTRREAEKRCEL